MSRMINNFLLRLYTGMVSFSQSSSIQSSLPRPPKKKDEKKILFFVFVRRINLYANIEANISKDEYSVLKNWNFLFFFS